MSVVDILDSICDLLKIKDFRKVGYLDLETTRDGSSWNKRQFMIIFTDTTLADRLRKCPFLKIVFGEMAATQFLKSKQIFIHGFTNHATKTEALRLAQIMGFDHLVTNVEMEVRQGRFQTIA